MYIFIYLRWACRQHTVGSCFLGAFWPSLSFNWCSKPLMFKVIVDICCSVTQSCLTLHMDSMDSSTPGFPVLHHLPELAQIHVHWVGDAIQLSCPLSSLLLLPSVFPSIRVFSNESALRIRWPKYWSFNFSISPSSEYSVLISFRIA